MIYTAVLGYGTVGSGVVELIEKNKQAINRRMISGEELEVKYILDLRDFPGDPYEEKVIHDVNLIMEDEEISIVCETMGGVGAAYQFTKMALERGKSVCTSNKELVAAHGPELLEIARAHACNYMFEASVGGGIPIIRPLNSALTAEVLESIKGILNGTTNYILTKMEKEGADFEDVLKEAQEKGYAERRPEADIEGHDACRKIAILSSLMLGKTVDTDRIYTEGISGITPADMLYAKAAHKTIKLLGISRRVGEKLLVMVAPFMVDSEDPLSSVDGVYNAICVTGNMLGKSIYYGRGAGKFPTASAVVGDVIDCARHIGKVITCFWDPEKADLADLKEIKHSFFLRVKAGTAEAVAALFPESKKIEIPGRTEDIGFLTKDIREKDFAERCDILGNAVLSTIRLDNSDNSDN